MTRNILLCLSLIIIVTISGTFYIKNKVNLLERDLVEITYQLTQERKNIHILEAEWAYMNTPERLQQLSEQYLTLKPIQFAQMHDQAKFQPAYLAKREGIDPSITPTLRPKLSSF